MNKNTFKTIVGVLFISTIASFLLYGHGIQLTIIKKYPCVVVNAKYHGSRGLAHANVIVRFENEKTEFQMGKTDKNGNFCFYPDQTGTWFVSVDDGMGHRSKDEVGIENDFFEVLPKPIETGEEKIEGKREPEEKTAPVQNDTCCYLLKIILGVFLILAISFVIYRLKKQRENKIK